MFKSASGGVNMANVILRLPAVLSLTGLSRSTIYLMMSNNEFPASISLGEIFIGYYGTVAFTVQVRFCAIVLNNPFHITQSICQAYLRSLSSNFWAIAHGKACKCGVKFLSNRVLSCMKIVNDRWNTCTAVQPLGGLIRNSVDGA